MRNPFRNPDQGPTRRQLRREIDDLTARNAELMDACYWYTDRLYVEFKVTEYAKQRAQQAAEHATEAEYVIDALTNQLEAERQKVAALEAIAGPYRDPSSEPTPCFNEVTQDIGLPDAPTLRIPVMHLSAKAAS